jgi:transcriptional regulator
MSLYVPGHFAARDPASAARLFHEHPFATLVTPSAPESFVTHLPLIHVADGEPHGTLHGHFARANPHVEAAMQAQSLAIFAAPTPTTPSWYTTPLVRCRLNYAVVHAEDSRATR